MYRFTLYDFTNSDGLTGVFINEPVGFDSLIIKIQRHSLYKGVNFEYGLSSIEVDDPNGYNLIKKAYESAGVNAKVNLKIEYKCQECKDCYETLMEMRLVYELYESGNESYCYTKVGLEPIGCRMLWKVNEDVKVNLESLLGFDGVTPLQPYEYLGKEIDLPSKAILFTNIGKQEEESMGGFTVGNGVGSGNPLDATLYFHIPFSLVLFNEISEFNPLIDIENDGVALNIDDNYFFKPEKSATYNINANIKARVEQEGATTFHNTTKLQVWKKNISGNILLDEIVYPTQSGSFGSPTNLNIDEAYSGIFTLDVGDKITMVFKIRSYVDIDDLCPLKLYVLEDTNIKITTLDITDSSPCKQFLINETFSRIVEATTNGCMRVYSQLLGRNDSQPYPSTDGCASLISITKGLFIRQVNKMKDENTQPVFSVSFKEVFEAVNAIYNIGCVVEFDQNRPDYECIRIEGADYFYKNTVALDLGEVIVMKKINAKEIYNIFKFGYEKWEAEEYNGLDEFLTKREYKTNLQIKSTFERICKFIASGYAIEITRRQGNDTSKDWRYDNDTFVICLKRGEDGGIMVEQGHITGAENIIDPDTILNFRISPVRNAMRWIRELFKGFKNQSDSKIDFTSGDGNYYAKGMYTGACASENIEIAENESVTPNKFINDQHPVPYLSPEIDLIKDYPLSYEGYKTIKANPHGLFAYTTGGVQYYAWLNNIEYNPSEGKADFNLIPKF